MRAMRDATETEAICTHCSTPVPVGLRACKHCGRPLTNAGGGSARRGRPGPRKMRTTVRKRIVQLAKRRLAPRLKRRASDGLMWVGVLELIGVALLWIGMRQLQDPSATPEGMSAQDVAGAVDSIRLYMVGNAVLGIAFIGLYYWSRAHALAASITGLILWSIIHGMALARDPACFMRGSVVTAVIGLILAWEIAASLLRLRSSARRAVPLPEKTPTVAGVA